MPNGNLVIFTNSALAQTKGASSGHTNTSDSPSKAARPRGTSVALRSDDARSASISSSNRVLFGFGSRRKAPVEAPAAVAFQRKHLANHVEVLDTCAALQLDRQRQVSQVHWACGYASFDFH
eukprot:m.130123 g.130123  ORF g.130123 m.130123 type:complete len:122 (-) comp15870_c1_seq5:3-368(-)